MRSSSHPTPVAPGTRDIVSALSNQASAPSGCQLDRPLPADSDELVNPHSEAKMTKRSYGWKVRITLLFVASLAVTACGGGEDPTGPAAVTGTLAGTVTNSATGDPIAGAQVRLGNVSVVTGGDGRFELAGLTMGLAVLRCTASGFEDFEAAITVTSGGTNLGLYLRLPLPSAPESQLSGVLAYVREGTILRTSVDGSGPVVLASRASQPAWSPDGSRIAFTGPMNYQLEKWQLCVAQADGSNVRCVVGDTDGHVEGRPSWSPDGSKIAFSFWGHSCPGGQCGQAGGFYSKLHILNTATMHFHTVSTPPLTSVSWSPGGRKIAFTAFGIGSFGRGALGMVNPDGSELNILAPSLGSYSIREVAWSPNGRRLALALLDENACPWYCNTAIGVVEADATQLRVTELRVLATGRTMFAAAGGTTVGTPAWSPDGAQIAYTITDEDSFYDDVGAEVLLVKVDGGESKVLISGGGMPSWRP